MDGKKRNNNQKKKEIKLNLKKKHQLIVVALL